MKKRLAVLITALACAANASAQCDGGNLVTNCSFESGTADWNVVSGFASQSTTARSGTFSLEVASEEVLTGIAYDTELNQCVEVTGGLTYSTGFFARTTSGVAACWPRVLWHSNSTCSNFVAIDSFPAAPVSNVDWTLLMEDKTAPSQALSASLDVVCTSGDGHFIVLYEDVFVVNAPIFSDGFEGGTAANWSSVVD